MGRIVLKVLVNAQKRAPLVVSVIHKMIVAFVKMVIMEKIASIFIA